MRKTRNAVAYSAVVLLVVLAAACGGSLYGPSDNNNPAITTINVTGGASVTVGSTLQLGAGAVDQYGTAIGGRTFTWTTSDASIATVSSSGLVTGIAAGTASIKATTGGKTGTRAVVVTAAGN